MQALTDFIEATLDIHPGNRLSSPFDAEWRSPCELTHDNETTFWRPLLQKTAQQTQDDYPVDFAGLANALETDIHEDVIAYYSSYWSGTLEASSEEGPVSLIQLWNSDDFDRLISNLVGHALNQRRSKNPFSVFFATTDPDSELFLSIHNESGVILLEEPGKKPLREVESDIWTFLRRLTPEIRSAIIY